MIRKSGYILFIVLLSSCVTNQPDNKLADLYFNLGDAYFRLEEYNKSIAAYNSAILYTKNNRTIKYNLARVYIENGQKAEALQITDELLKEDPDNGLLLELKGYILLSSGHLDEALVPYLKILEMAPGHANALFNCSLIYSKMEDYSSALEYLEKYYEKTDKNADAYIRLADAAGKADDSEKRISYLKEASALNSKDATLTLAEYYYREGDYLSSLEFYEKLLSMPDYEFTWNFELAWIYLFSVEDIVKGIEYLDLAVKSGKADLKLIEDHLAESEYLWEKELREYLDSQED